MGPGRASPFIVVNAWRLQADLGSRYRVGPIPAAYTQPGGPTLLVVADAELSMNSRQFSFNFQQGQ